jgi:U3 small nucleolar ribonucleoprotein protein IMP4
MTVITTSRKPVPEIRTLAKDLAYATGCEYLMRGKMGMKDLISHDPVYFLISKDKGIIRIEFYDKGEKKSDLSVSSLTVTQREDNQRKGIYLSNQSVYEQLKPYIPVELTVEGGRDLSFDGTRRSRYNLTLADHGT